MASDTEQTLPLAAQPADPPVDPAPADGDDASAGTPTRARAGRSGRAKASTPDAPDEPAQAAPPAKRAKAAKGAKAPKAENSPTAEKAAKGAKTTKADKADKADKPAKGGKAATPRRRSRATADAEAPAEQPADGQPEAARAEAAQPEAAAPERTRRSRSARTAEAAPPEPVLPDVEEDVEEAPADDETAGEEPQPEAAPAVPAFGLLFQAPEPTVVSRRRRATSPAQAPAERPADEPEAVEPRTEEEPEEAEETPTETAEERPESEGGSRGRRRRGGRGRRGRGRGEDEQEAPEGSGAETTDEEEPESSAGEAGEAEGESGTSRRRRRRRRSGSSGTGESEDPPGTVTRVREPRSDRDEPTAVKGSTRLEAKKQRRREGREAGRRRTVITEAEFLARRESVERVMVVRGREGRTQIGVLEDGVLVEHYVSRETSASMAGNVYLGRVQNVLPSMEAAFVDIGKGRNAVLYAGEVNWDAAGLEVNQSKRIENALSSGDTVLVQVTKDPIGHKGARLTSQISLPGRYLVYVPEGQMTGISRKLPDTERARLKAILKEVVPDSAGVIVRTAAEGASEEELRADVERLTKQWERIRSKADSAGAKKSGNGGAPVLLHGEPDLTIRVIRDVFTEDFTSLVVSGDQAWSEVSEYVEDVAPDLAPRLSRWTSEDDVFAAHRIDEQLAKAMDRKVWLPSGGSLVIDRTEAMTVVDVNTGKFVGSGGNLEETVTKNNLEAAEEIVRQLRLRDIGGIIVIDFIDMVLESNRDLVVRRLLECLGRDRTKHQVAEVTSLGLVQMTRKRVGSGLIEVFSEQCEHCGGRGIVVHTEPVERGSGDQGGSSRSSRGRRASGSGGSAGAAQGNGSSGEARPAGGPTAAQIAAAAHAAALKHTDQADLAAEVAAEVADAVGVDVVAAEPGPADAGVDVPAVGATEPDSDGATAAEPTASEASEEQLPTSQPVAAPPTSEAPEPVVRPRRRRGRVVAPAGPPPGAEPVLVPEPAGGIPNADDGEPGEGSAAEA
ncbi:MAG TPA: Rne/Rng family ribonuclease [Phycicoccus sp.]|nr:Rne/Rng family ribonuclease [Phycicoccus sp.]